MADGDKEYAAEIADRLVALGPVRARRMFGGHGIFLDGTMFGLVWRGALYFKVGEANRAEYERAHAAPFAYLRGPTRIEMSYAAVPKTVLTDPALLAEWGERALAVARTPKRKKRR